MKKVSPRRPESAGRLMLKRPFPHMLRTVWRNPRRYERDWQQIPGCYVTGDVAVKDKDGYIAVIGRADDVLNVAGHRIGTAEVESALVSHPAVAEAAAIGIPDAVEGRDDQSVHTNAGRPCALRGAFRSLDRACQKGTGSHRNSVSAGVCDGIAKDAIGEDSAPVPESERDGSRYRRRFHYGRLAVTTAIGRGAGDASRRSSGVPVQTTKLPAAQLSFALS